MNGIIAKMPKKAVYVALRSQATHEALWGQGQKANVESDLP
jgi:hypothetical protein